MANYHHKHSSFAPDVLCGPNLLPQRENRIFTLLVRASYLVYGSHTKTMKRMAPKMKMTMTMTMAKPTLKLKNRGEVHRSIPPLASLAKPPSSRNISALSANGQLYSVIAEKLSCHLPQYVWRLLGWDGRTRRKLGGHLGTWCKS